MKAKVLWEGEEMNCHCVLPLLRYWHSPSCWLLQLSPNFLHPFPQTPLPPTHSWAICNSGWGVCTPWRLNYARSIILRGVCVCVFAVSLSHFRVLLFLCEWNVRNEFHRVISQALTGLCHLSLDRGFNFGFLPCLDLSLWVPVILPLNVASSDGSLCYQVWLVPSRYGVISPTGFAFHYF